MIGKEIEQLEKFGNYNPPILNCKGGWVNGPLNGCLTIDQIQEVKSIPIVKDDESSQETISIETPCLRKGKIDIYYYPKEIAFSISSNNLLISEIGAVCPRTNCEYNLGASPKKS